MVFIQCIERNRYKYKIHWSFGLKCPTCLMVNRELSRLAVRIAMEDKRKTLHAAMRYARTSHICIYLARPCTKNVWKREVLLFL